MNQLFFFTWGENKGVFLEASDDLSIFLSSVRTIVKEPHLIFREAIKKSPRANVILFIDELPSLEKLAMKGRNWKQQLQSAFYQLELMRYQALQLLKSIVNFTHTLTILVTRQLPQLEKTIWQLSQRKNRRSFEYVDVKSVTIPKWAFELEKWFFVLEEGPSLLDVREVTVTVLSPQKWSLFPPRDLQVRHLGISSENHHERSPNICTSIAKYWLTLATTTSD